MTTDERWQPDDGMVFTLRTRCVPIKELPRPEDRAWVVASLTAAGWTVSAIADRLRCSLRLVQQIKTDPITMVALYALQLDQQLREERALRHMAAVQHTAEVAALRGHIDRLTAQRDLLLTHVAPPAPLRKDPPRATPQTARGRSGGIPRPTRAARLPRV